jgi:diguanylate cyclase (GGDEF)-like protein
MRIGSFALVLAVFGVSLLLAGLAGDPPVREVRVGIYENAPKVYHDLHERPAGLFVDLIREIARLERWRIEFVACDWADCLQRLQRGDIDLMPDVAFSVERARHFDFNQVSVAHSWSEIHVHPTLQVQTLPDLAHHRIAVLRGAIQENALHQMLSAYGLSYTLVSVESLADGFEAVLHGEADAVVSNTFFTGRHGRHYGLRETPIVFNPANLYFATARDRNGDLLERIDHYLTLWRQDANSTYFEAMRRSMAPLPEFVVPAALRWSLIGIAALLALFALMSLLLRWQVRRRTAELARTSRRLDQLLDASPVVLYLLHQDDGGIRPQWVSDNIARLFGFRPEEVLAPAWWASRLHPQDREAAFAALSLLPNQNHLVHEYRLLDAEDRVRHIRDEMQFVPGQPNQIVGSWSDLTESREQADRLSFLTHHDPLTGLPNRVLLHDRLVHALHRAQRELTSLSLLIIDLDRFKNVNDTLGHPIGDEMLIAIARRMEAVIRTGDTLARIGGDEFALLLENHAGAHQASLVARKLLHAFAAPLEIGGHQLVITASIGIGLFPDDGDDADTLLKHAELALYEAKNQGRNSFRFFDPALSSGVLERLVMENALRGAVDRDELVLHYQPQIDLHTGALTGVEALVRWQHPEIGLVPPIQFIPLAEETGLIGDIGAWVLHEACRQMVEWDAHGLRLARVSVNLSVRQIERGDVWQQIAAVLADTGLDPHRLELEVTESIIMHDPDKATAALSRFKEQGVMLAVDDFGTGYSSLAYLRRLPIDRLKIDRSFVHDIGSNAGDEAICRAVIGLARSLELETVAEGVEREEQAVFLRNEGCEIAQGYLYGRPLPAEELFARYGATATEP